MILNFGGGADVGMAFRPVDVMALGLDLEKRGRINSAIRYEIINSDDWSCLVYLERIPSAELDTNGVDQRSCILVKAIKETRISGFIFVAEAISELLGTRRRYLRALRPRAAFCCAWVTAACVLVD